MQYPTSQYPGTWIYISILMISFSFLYEFMFFSFLSQRKAQEAEWSQIFSEDEELYTRGGDSLNYNKRGQDPYKHQGKDSQLGMYKRRAMEDKRGAPNSNFK